MIYMNVRLKILYSNIQHELIEINNDLDDINYKINWKHLIQIKNASGKSFGYPNNDDWNELRIYSIVNNGTLCVLEISIIKNIITDEVQYKSDTIYANSSSYDTIIVAFSTKDVTVHNMFQNGELTNGVINVFYK